MKKNIRQDSSGGRNQGEKAIRKGRGEENSDEDGKAVPKRGKRDVMPPKIYTVKDLARILQYDSTLTIYRMRQKGELPDPLPFEGALRWDGNKFDEWVQDGCPKPKKRRK